MTWRWHYLYKNGRVILIVTFQTFSLDASSPFCLVIQKEMVLSFKLVKTQLSLLDVIILSWRHFSAPALGHLQVTKLFIYSRTLYSISRKIYLLTPRCRVLPEQLTGLQLVKKFPAFHGTRRFITALTSVRQLSLSWASPIQSTCPHPTSWRSILILSNHLRLGLPSGLFPSGFPHQDPIHPPLLTHTRHMPSPSHSSCVVAMFLNSNAK